MDLRFAVETVARVGAESLSFAGGLSLNPIRLASRSEFSLTLLRGSLAYRHDPFPMVRWAAGNIHAGSWSTSRISRSHASSFNDRVRAVTSAAYPGRKAASIIPSLPVRSACSLLWSFRGALVPSGLLSVLGREWRVDEDRARWQGELLLLSHLRARTRLFFVRARFHFASRFAAAACGTESAVRSASVLYGCRCSSIPTNLKHDYRDGHKGM
jgi:hypothetical protein